MKLAIVSLGCPKNQVDADRFCRALLAAGHETVPQIELAAAVIINTCGFIESAKEEAIEAILDACALKKENPALRVVACGCLAERYREEVAREIPELDAVVGIGAAAQLPEILGGLRGQKTQCFFGPKTALPLEGERIISTPGHYAWLKIAEGCSNACSYCAIPGIRGPQRSRAQSAVLAEARWLAQQGVREVVLVAQDVTAYGNDRGEAALPALLKELNAVDGIEWIRLLYAYPEKIGPALLGAMAQSEKVLPYLDLPVQHIDDDILRAMGRRGGSDAIHRAIEMIRAQLPGATLRTSLIAGFPGESAAQFEKLCAFVRDVRFDRLGCFAYSPEEGTRAAQFPGQLPEQERQRRAEVVMETQQRIMAEKQDALVGKRLRVLCDGLDETGTAWLCRSAADAPEIDANVLLDAAAPCAAGAFCTVTITGADGLDLLAEMAGEGSRA
ncbi:MAG: 30S ribosomal protein S12 methylthiotransferase RimO [Oscillospiraceae bacterium]